MGADKQVLQRRESQTSATESQMLQILLLTRNAFGLKSSNIGHSEQITLKIKFDYRDEVLE